MEDEVAIDMWKNHMLNCKICNYMVSIHCCGTKTPREMIKDMSDRLDVWKEKHGKEWKGYE